MFDFLFLYYMIIYQPIVRVRETVTAGVTTVSPNLMQIDSYQMEGCPRHEIAVVNFRIANQKEQRTVAL
jgi:hypothetical protein